MRTDDLLDLAYQVIERAQERAGEIEFDAPFLACQGGIGRHIDIHFPPWSAFLTLRNDGCRVWQEGGYAGSPKVGERFTVHIHRMHGVRVRSKRDLLVVMCADGDTEHKAKRALALAIKQKRAEARFVPGEALVDKKGD